MGTLVHNPPAPGSPEHNAMVTASKVAAMIRAAETGDFLGLGYTSAFDLWHVMAGGTREVIDDAKQEMFDDAHDAEDYAVNVWRRRNPGWQTNKGEVAYTDLELPFPNLVTLDRRARRGSKRKIVEVKRPRKDDGLRDGWRAQTIFQMGVSGILEADLIVAPMFGRPRIYPVEWSPELYTAIVRDALAFWESIQDGTPPPATGDSTLASQIFAERFPDPEGEIDLPEELVERWTAAISASARAETEVSTIENEIREHMGSAAAARWNSERIVSRRSGRFSQARIPADRKDELSQYTSRKFDAALLKKADPELYQLGLGAPTYSFERKKWIND